MTGDANRFFLRAGRLPQSAEALHQLSGVDADWTGGCAQSVRRTGVEGRIGEFAVERGVESIGSHPVANGWRQGWGTRFCYAFAVLQARHLATNDDALARGQGQFAAGALRLAVAALNALVDFRLDGGNPLQVFEMRARIGVDDDARIEQVMRVGQFLQPPHNFVACTSP